MKKSYSLFSIAIIAFLSSITIIFAQNASGKYKAKSYFKFPENIREGDYQEKTVVLKIKLQYANLCFKDNVQIDNLNNFLSEIGATQTLRKFPAAQKPEREYNPQGLKYADLTRIYQFTYSENIPLETVINVLYSMGHVDYAEPNYIMKTLYTVNDPNVGQQWHINKIKANLAWDITKGDTNVVIGIVDSEIQWDHPDLSPNIKYNYADPINGADDDNDGYIDNFRGYDLGEGDNDTKSSANIHGTHVSGCASPATDNGIGVAGPGFNCKLLPVKISNNAGSLIAGYEGITYAADHGAKIINCSWGSAGGGQAGQDVIDYVTINKDALVVAAAGNDANEIELFPAAYNYVLSVAATNNQDKKAYFSSYGTWVDISSPGQGIYATYPTNTYSSLDGTSMASPVAAGAAALIRSQYPNFNALQAGEQLRVTCDPMTTDAQYNNGKMGNGRINLFAAVSGVNTPSVVMIQKNITNNGDETFIIGDTINISGVFVNYLNATGNITATLTTTTPTYITIVNGNATLGVIQTLANANNNNNPFRVVIKNGTPVNAKALFTVTLTDGSYTRKEYLSFTVNVDYINIAINEVATSITSKSLIGFNDFSTQLEGLGFRYIPGDAENLMFDGGLMVGIPNKVSDNVRNGGAGTDVDFSSVTRVKKVIPAVASEFDVQGIFNDNGAGTAKLPVEISHKAYAWNTTGHRRYVMVEYSIKNTGTATLSTLYAGIATDWDINMQQSNGYANNKCSTDTARKLGYVWNVDQGGFYAGIQLLTTNNRSFIHYAMDNNSGTAGIHPNVSYNSADKYTTLSTMKTDAGNPVQDVSDVVSTGPFTIAPGDSVTIAFSILAGDNLSDIQKSADSACAQYPFGLLASITSPACGSSDGSAAVSVVGCGSTYSYLWSNGQTTSTATGLSAGNYSVTVTNPTGRKAVKIISISNNNAPVSTISATDATSCNSNDGIASVAASGGATPYTYLWSNGATTSSINNLAPDDYLVTVTGANNCSASLIVTVSAFSDLSASVSTIKALCGGASGSASVAIASGTAPFTYLWSNGDTASSAINLLPGTYYVTVTGANSCKTTLIANVGNNVQSNLSVTYSATSATCGQSDGSATVTASGTGPFTYSWSNGSSLQTINNISAGIYYVTVTETSGCNDIVTVTVGNTSDLALASSVSNSSDPLNCNGTAAISISGGTSPFTYSWSNGQSIDSISGLCAGTYTLTVTDNNGCIATTTIIISQVITSVNNIGNEKEISFTIYPNPYFGGSFSNVEIVAAQKENVELSIYDLLGQKVYSANNLVLSQGKNTFSIDISTFESGIYFYRLKTSDGIYTKKMIITK